MVTSSCKQISESLYDTDEAALFIDFNVPNIQWLPHDELSNVYVPHGAHTDSEFIVADGLS